MEIWQKIPTDRIENSCGALTEQAKRSLNGKLGLANGKYFKKVEHDWIFAQKKDEKSLRPFALLSINAVLKCKERARQQFR